MATIQEIQPILIEANERGYSNPETKIVDEPDGSHTIAIDFGNGWKLHDNFFGGEPYGGREVISHLGRPEWMMVYYGKVIQSSNPDSIYPTLRRALAAQPEDLPVRGPKHFEDGNLVYENDYEGTLEGFKGHERILSEGQEVYFADYSGGMVDLRKD